MDGPVKKPQEKSLLSSKSDHPVGVTGISFKVYTSLLLCFYDRLRHQLSSYVHDLAVIYSRRWDNVSPHVLIPQLLIPVNGSHMAVMFAACLFTISLLNPVSIFTTALVPDVTQQYRSLTHGSITLIHTCVYSWLHMLRLLLILLFVLRLCLAP